MAAHAIMASDPFHPWKGRRRLPAVVGEPISSLAVVQSAPFIIIRNGEAILRAEWESPISDGDIFAVVVLPMGGGGSNPMRVVAMLAIAVLAAYTGGAAFGAVGSFGAGATGGFFGVSSIGSALVSSAVMLAGSALVNALIPPSSLPSSQQAAQLASPSPTYNLQAQGNMARLGAAIPVQYGRMTFFPDFAALPYLEYAGNEQYLYQLFCLGCGEYDVKAIYIEDTPIDNFAEVEYEVIAPGDTLTMFPANVISSSEVSGQELLKDVYIGPFVANNAGTNARRLGIDVVLPLGLFHVNEEGALESLSLSVQVEAREIDLNGDPVGSWVVLEEKIFTLKTTTPQRASLRYTVASGRYEVRMTRTDVKQTGTSYGHEVVWSGLRAYLPETRSFGNVTLLAIKMRASNNLSARASRRVNVDAARKLPIWDGDAWSANTETSSIAWAIADACRDDDYGASLADTKIDLATLLELDAVWEDRHDEFNGRFDSIQSFWEAVNNIARVGRAKAYMQAGIVRVVRDGNQQAPVALFNMRNIIRGSFNVKYLMPSEDTVDKVEVTYFDNTRKTTKSVLSELPDSVSARPVKVDLFGSTSRRQAHVEGIYMAACNRYRRKLISFETEMDGFIPSLGDLIAVSHDMVMWGQSAEAVSWNGEIMELSEPVTWTDGATHYAGLCRSDGSLSGPYQVTQGETNYLLCFVDIPDFTPYTGNDMERTRVAFGPGEAWRQPAKVLAIDPRSITSAAIECINEDPSVHTAEDGVVLPAEQYSELPSLFTVPVIKSINVRSSPSDAAKSLIVWAPAPGADTYQVEMAAGTDPMSADLVWTRVGETTANNLAVTVLYGAQTLIRVRGVGMSIGPWSVIFFGSSSDYMFVDDAALMWNADDSTLMWSA